MKKSILFLFLATVALSCTGQTNKPAQKQAGKPASATIKMTSASFKKQVYNYKESPNQWKYLGDKPCIIDFYATWCGPCKQIAPILEDLATEYKGKIYIYKIDVDKEKEIASAFGIRSIPTILFCPMQGEPQMAQGALPKDVFKEAIVEVLNIK